MLIKKVQVNHQSAAPFYIDIAIRRAEFDHEGYPPIFYQGTIKDLGDLSTQYGYQEIPEQGLVYEPGKTYPEQLLNQQAIIDLGVNALLQQGYTNVLLEELPSKGSNMLPFNLITSKNQAPVGLDLEMAATFLLLKNGTLKYAVINGYVHQVDQAPDEKGRGWVFN